MSYKQELKNSYAVGLSKTSAETLLKTEFGQEFVKNSLVVDAEGAGFKLKIRSGFANNGVQFPKNAWVVFSPHGEIKNII